MKIILILTILLIIFLLLREKPPKSGKIEELDEKLHNVLASLGYEGTFELTDHPSKSFTHNKKDVYVCTSCSANNIDKLLYVGLHEIAHSLSSRSHEKDPHGPEWKSIFMKLLESAGDLGYLDKTRIR
jgi:hypothetical protein